MRRREINQKRTEEAAMLNESRRNGLICERCLRTFKNKQGLGRHRNLGKCKEKAASAIG